MDIFLSEDEIMNLIKEPKRLSEDLTNLNMKSPKKGHYEKEIIILRDDGSRFEIKIRQSIDNVMDFSVILGYIPYESEKMFRLRRYNGKRIHTNRIEREIIFGYHIHTATERYQKAGYDEDAFAIVTGEFYDLNGAIECFIKDCSIIFPTSNQVKLF